MIKGIQYFVILSIIITLSALIPAYAEVTSFSTDSQFYKGGSSITFSGTIQSTDSPNVTIVIFDPTNKFVTLTSALANADTHSFQTKFDTSTPSNQHLLTLKGVYNATAFISKQENGKTITFVFSPDGSAVIPSSPTNLTSTVPSSTEIDLNWLPPKNEMVFRYLDTKLIEMMVMVSIHLQRYKLHLIEILDCFQTLNIPIGYLQ